MKYVFLAVSLGLFVLLSVTPASADNNCQNIQKWNGGSVNNNCNNNSNWQSQSQTQNNNQSVTISMPAVQQVVQMTTLPSTGPSDALGLIFLSGPVGYIIRRLGTSH